MREIRYRVDKLKRMSKRQRLAYFDDRIVPTVMGPDARLYMIDHHHLTRACWELGIEEIRINIIADLSHLSHHAFWAAMTTNGWVYPYDQYGHGPHDPARYLPETIQGLADDPYRGIAWLAREAGAYDKVHSPFVEFKWADFLRKRMKTHPNTHDMKTVMREAIRLCKSTAAKKLKLPGIK